MSTIAQHIGALRVKIRIHEDDTKYNDQVLYHFLNQAAGVVLSRTTDRFKKVSEFSWRSYCVPLEESDRQVCGTCLPIADCKIFKTVDSIPVPHLARNRELMEVYSLGFKQLSPSNNTATQLDPVLGNGWSYRIVNGYVFIENVPKTIELKAVIIRQVPADITNWVGKKLCDTAGALIGTCFNLDSDDFNMDSITSRSSLMAYDLAMESLGIIPVNENTPS